MTDDKKSPYIDCPQPKICAVRLQQHEEMVHGLKKGQDLILEEVIGIKKKLYIDNGGECVQSKINKNDARIKVLSDKVKCVYLVGVFVLAAIGTLIIEKIWIHLF